MSTRAPESVGLSSSRLERLGTAFARRIQAGELAGVATMVARKGHLAHFNLQGMADLEERKPLAEDTISHIYSMMKPITTVALLALLEEGFFQLDDPVAPLIPELVSLKVLARMEGERAVLEDLQRPITFRYSFTHTSGICYPGVEGSPPAERLLGVEMGGAYFREFPLTLAEWVPRLVRVTLAHQLYAG